MTVADILSEMNKESELEWRKNANCAGYGHDRFFLERGDKSTAAKAVCRECVVQQECLRYAISNGIQHGIWGGMSSRQRRKHKLGLIEDRAA